MDRASSEGSSFDLPVNDTLRRIVVLLRVLGWMWMMILVAITFPTDPGANGVVVGVAAALGTIGMAATVWAARTDQMATRWFVVFDVVVALVIGAASTAAGAKDLFHGGYPSSALGVAAYRFGIRGALIAALALATEQAVVHVVDPNKSVVGAAGSIVFFVFAIILGWAFDALREHQRKRLEAEGELARVRDQKVRRDERLQLANRLHDSVLQTLIALRNGAEDPTQVRYLARRQERDLRRTISNYRSQYDPSARAGIEAVCDEIEDTYRIEVEAVIRGDAPLTENHEALIAAAREALINAAKHSGVDRVDLYADIRNDMMEIYVRDRGVGFEPDRVGRAGGIDHGLHLPLDAIGGRAEINAAPDGGTEVALSWATA